ncbi:MAG: metallophosphoesterase [Gemmatimonadota bacterium]|nr:MAG: metallophosphoesterase [Gemmatimonadota bacterium]
MSVLASGTIVRATVGALCLSAVASVDTANVAVVARHAAGPDTIAPADDWLDDGPHIYWETPSRAIVFHLCNRLVIANRYARVRGTLRFHGFCSDSATEYVIAARAPRIESDNYSRVSKFFAVSDIHGEYEALVDLLQAAGIIDQDLQWSWGEGHLVIVGDIFDRGDKVTECLWLLYRLEKEAREADGRVHVMLGNHEVMVLQNDVRYVNEKYSEGIVKATGITYSDLYGPDMELGRWLRSKHTAIKLNDMLFVHGGLPPVTAENDVSVRALNELTRETIDARSYVRAFNEPVRKHYGDTGEGPFWFRGYHDGQNSGYPHVTSEQIDSILDAYDVGTIVVGHTEVDRIESLYDGRVIGIDVRLEDLGSFQGLLWNEGHLFRVLGDGTRESLAGEG